MIAIFKHLRDKWNDWCGDHEMELAIRKHLTECGYFGHTAKLKSVRLVAVKRPGWLQIYRFEAVARLDPSRGPLAVPPGTPEIVGEQGGFQPEGKTDPADPNGGDQEEPAASLGDSQISSDQPTYHELFGLFREDARQKASSTRVFATEDERRSLFTQWSEGLICLRGSQGL